MRKEKNNHQKVGYRDLTTQKDYLKLIVANVINRFGDSIDSIAFTWLVYAVTGNAVWSAVIFGANQLPTILLQPFTGAIVEKWNKKRLMVLADLIRGGLVVGFAALYLTKLLTPWLMLLFTISISAVEAFRVPAGMSLVPKILERRLYEFGTGLNSTLSTVMQMAGLAAAGVIIGSLGVEVAILIDAVTYFLSAGIIGLIHYRENKGEAEALKEHEEQPAGGAEEKKQSPVRVYVQNLKEGFSYIKKRSIIVNFCILGFCINGLMVPMNALQAPLISEVLGRGSEFMSLLNIMTLLGMGAASFLYPYFRKHVSGTKMVVVSGVALGICYVGLPLAGTLREQVIVLSAVCMVCQMVMGISASLISSVLGVEFMKSVEESFMARCAGVFNAVSSASMPIVSALCSAAAVFLDVSVIFIACGVLTVVLFISTVFAKMKFEEPKLLKEA